MGGDIGIENTPDGAQVWFTVAYDIAGTKPEAARIPAAAPSPGLTKCLLVDDDEDLREARSEQLIMTEDFDVFEAGNGADAMEKAREALYDLIILDVGLPDNDGRELCRLMRKQGVKCPVLMLTGHDSAADTILGLAAGVLGLAWLRPDRLLRQLRPKRVDAKDQPAAPPAEETIEGTDP